MRQVEGVMGLYQCRVGTGASVLPECGSPHETLGIAHVTANPVVVTQRNDDLMARPRPALGRNLRRLRQHAGLSQHELAGRSGVSRPTIARIESGSQATASLDTIEALAKALGVRSADLTEQEEESGASIIAPVIDEWLILEKMRPVTRPTDEEIQWLRSLPGVFWLQMDPTVDTLHHLVEAYRARKQRGKS